MITAEGAGLLQASAPFEPWLNRFGPHPRCPLLKRQDWSTLIDTPPRSTP